MEKKNRGIWSSSKIISQPQSRQIIVIFISSEFWEHTSLGFVHAQKARAGIIANRYDIHQITHSIKKSSWGEDGLQSSLQLQLQAG